MIYQSFAQLYDQLFDPEMYRNWEKFTLENLQLQDKKILDLAGGSGRLAVLLAKKDLEVTVADFSATMLSLADQHAAEASIPLQLVQADMRDLSAFPQYDAITCYADSICYLNGAAEVQQTFKEVAKHLKNDGVFLFDVITPYQTDKVYPGYMYNYEDEDHQQAFMWQSFANDSVNHGVIHELTFFIREEDGRYERVGETHYERAYELSSLKQMLNQAGFNSVSVGSDFSTEMKSSNPTRLFFRCQK
ncbi:class I SAM-dependent methyltransferase [Limosilactobacillus sp. STM2_1]|uniref:Class I SAM-dependent methyltransferase n=1 Tax=Limosilactobacillus rudii TaxID=2759755 RepID=A0A7W3UIV6_9LACO|nr:class I SAM-dependent methyltransferase [Limosilactobacillus rudii]MBB1080103.1 class I SAM-dependent methyltransferase [Limosilactobacillus rudii]MBB1096409.1 class I SAM-dependent methyltransferase [Limosilactobacillus rudii]MCD7133590.1 class I SAM-dependent methyltransferase [Limosilactobacillus rudii]